MSSSLLVTGAGGFIGRALVKALLERGESVVANDIRMAPLLAELDRGGVSRANLSLVEGDIAEPSTQEECTHDARGVFHLAAAHLSVSAPDAEYRRTNVDAVRSLIETCSDRGVERFVHLSSVGVFGAIENPPADEATPCRPESIYERTKLEGEQVVLRAAREHGFPAIVLRPAWVYGPGDERTEKLFRAIAKGRFVQAGRGDMLRHSIYIEDMVRACLVASTNRGPTGQVVIIGDRQPRKVAELLATIADLCGVDPPRQVPLPLLWLAGWGAEAVFGVFGKEPPLSRRTLRFFSGNTAFDTSRARDLLGFEASYDLERGLEATYRQIEARSSKPTSGPPTR